MRWKAGDRALLMPDGVQVRIIAIEWRGYWPPRRGAIIELPYWLSAFGLVWVPLKSLAPRLSIARRFVLWLKYRNGTGKS